MRNGKPGRDTHLSPVVVTTVELDLGFAFTMILSVANRAFTGIKAGAVQVVEVAVNIGVFQYSTRPIAFQAGRSDGLGRMDHLCLERVLKFLRHHVGKAYL